MNLPSYFYIILHLRWQLFCFVTDKVFLNVCCLVFRPCAMKGWTVLNSSDKLPVPERAQGVNKMLNCSQPEREACSWEMIRGEVTTLQVTAVINSHGGNKKNSNNLSQRKESRGKAILKITNTQDLRDNSLENI